jgi:predicted GNAT family acetyltransferase
MPKNQDPIGIEHSEDDGRGAFFVQREGIQLAEMTYSRASAALVIIDHTLVDEQLRGLGVARRLLDSLVSWARATNTRVMATCPYALAQFAKDPSLRDVFDGDPRA